MRTFLLVLGAWFLSGCGEVSLPIPSQEVLPVTVSIEKEGQQSVGVGILFQDNVFVAPDHLLQHGDLFVDQTLIEIVARDFDHDVLFFRLPDDFVLSENFFADSPPVIGRTYYRSDVNGVQTLVVDNVGGDFSLGGESEKKNLIVFEGIIQPGESGTPVFDLDGAIYSMLIAADIPKGFSYGVRSDVLLEIYEDQVE